MLRKKPSWEASDGRCYPTLEEGQVVEIQTLLSDGKTPHDLDNHYAVAIVKNKDAVLNILTITETSRPAARKANGATRKPRTPKIKVAPQPETLPGV